MSEFLSESNSEYLSELQSELEDSSEFDSASGWVSAHHDNQVSDNDQTDTNTNTQDRLPQTGTKSSDSLSIAGGLMAALALGYLPFKKKKKED
ncbi:LPXTG-motif protein cell wall anchor domain protein [Enterococcus faecalis 13-SD-W-01]|nr:LPXTG-motif protein cell wall anchor domain protein [Enterococcus faecalis 13-SD-W-01]